MVTRLVLLHCCDTFHCPILFRNLKARNCPMQREIRSQSETALTNITHWLRYSPAQHKRLSVMKLIVSAWNILIIEQLAAPMTCDNGLDYGIETDLSASVMTTNQYPNHKKCRILTEIMTKLSSSILERGARVPFECLILVCRTLIDGHYFWGHISH